MEKLGLVLRCIALLLSVWLMAVPGAASAQAQAGGGPLIQIDVDGTAERRPDIASVTLGVTGDAADRDTALARHSENVLRILGTIREAGVPAKDIEQLRPRVSPLFETWVENHQEYRGAQTGFRASTRIVLTLRDMDRAGRVIQTVIHAGANYIDAIEFQLAPDRQAAAQAEARAEAIAKARRFAARFAQETGAAGVEFVSAEAPPPPDGAADMYIPPAPRDWGPPLIIEPGVIEINEKVRAVFRVLR
jgi:uncharacterized protein YggE